MALTMSFAVALRTSAVTRLEDLTKGTLVRGVLGDRAVRVVDVLGTVPTPSP